MENLLNRKENPCSVDFSALHGKRVLVTGAAGSVGSAVVNTLAGHAEVSCLDVSEEKLFWLKQNIKAEYLLGDVRSLTLADIQRHDIVVHTAAYKHVRLLEDYPEQAIKNNVGTVANLAGMCWHAGRHLCFISTDKAVEATGIMGRTKWVAERCVDSWRHLGLKTTILRFANVLGSSGSVLEVWARRQNNMISVTGNKMRRWFITPREAAAGILRAVLESDNDNYLFAIKPDEETAIIEMAKRYARANGCKIKYTCPGMTEKIAEKFCHENQYLEQIEGNLYVIRRADIPDRVCQPGANIPAWIGADPQAFERQQS